MPGAFPLVGTMAALQEEHFQGADMPTIDPSLRAGKITKWGEWVKSKPLVVNGVETRWRILGKYDLVSTNEDGSIGLIDCKVSDSQRDSGQFYSPQLEAYAYALENPEKGKRNRRMENILFIRNKSMEYNQVKFQFQKYQFCS